MAVPLHLDRKAWAAVFAAGAVVVGGTLFPVVKFAVQTLHQPTAMVAPPTDQVVVLRDGSTMLVTERSPIRRIEDWLKSGSAGEEQASLDNSNFVAGSTALTKDGWEQLTQFSQVLDADRDMAALILFSADGGNPSRARLEEERAKHIGAELVQLGVKGEQVEVAPATLASGEDSPQAGLTVVLARKVEKTG